MKKAMTAKEKDIVRALEAALRMEKGEKVKGITSFVYSGTGKPKEGSMKGSTVNWEDGLMENLRDPEFAKGYVAACLEEGVPLEIALRDVVRGQGVAKVARRAHLDRSDVIRALRPQVNLTLGTVERLLSGVGLVLAVRPIEVVKRSGRRVSKPGVAAKDGRRKVTLAGYSPIQVSKADAREIDALLAKARKVKLAFKKIGRVGVKPPKRARSVSKV
jgi:DNA-binding phage protein